MKQVIVIRTHYPDGNGGVRKIRTGKLIAQAGHAVLGCFVEVLTGEAPLSPEQKSWLVDGGTKICVYVRTEEELREVHQAAVDAGLNCQLVVDGGRTEFKEPTVTALAIGPDVDEKLEPITGHLPLY